MHIANPPSSGTHLGALVAVLLTGWLGVGCRATVAQNEAGATTVSAAVADSLTARTGPLGSSVDKTHEPGLAAAVGLTEGPDALSEAAVIQLLAFRERLYLPFRYGDEVPVAPAGLGSERDLSSVARGFAALGGEGLRALERCVDQAADGQLDSIHLAGDDAALTGRACIAMMGDVYGSAALPYLADLASGGRSDAVGVQLQVAALQEVRRIAGALRPAPPLPVRRWREEAVAWVRWLDKTGPLTPNVDPTPTCEESCAQERLVEWIVFAARHVPLSADSPEPRLLATLQDYLARRSERWLPWLEQVVQLYLEQLEERPPSQTGLVFRLWAAVAHEVSPSTFDAVVVPTLVAAIDPVERPQTVQRRVSMGQHEVLTIHWVTHSEMAIAALERATNQPTPVTHCDHGPFDHQARRQCLTEAAEYWRSRAAATVAAGPLEEPPRL